MPDRFLVSRTPHCILACLLEVVYCFAIVASLFKVHGEFRCDLSGSVTIGLLFALADAVMQLPSSCRREAMVEDFLIERMEETVPRGDGAVRPVSGATGPYKALLLH